SELSESSPQPSDDVAADGEGQMLLLLEFDGVLQVAPPGHVWHRLDSPAVERLAPSSVRAAVSTWLDERDHGWSPRRPVWSRPGWHAPAAAWMVEQMSLAGQPPTTTPRIHHLWDLSVVLEAGSAQGAAFLKCSPEIFRHEAVITRA